MKFLHIADVHLGCTRYQLPESPRDFFDAWADVLQRYAIDENVDFVIMSGDFFHKRNVPPETMNHAVAGLSMLKDAGIPCVSIEGNHDQHLGNEEHTWLRALRNWRLLYLLEPDNKDGNIFYKPWDDGDTEGGFIDIGNARIFGSSWYGAQANWAIPMLTESIRQNRREGAFHILLLHTDVEGHQTHPIPALSVDNLKKLKEVTDYVALGHTHKCYEIDNWAFNPGSLEITNIEEYREVRGAFLVEFGEDLVANAQHLRRYKQRPFKRISFDISTYDDASAITRDVLAMVDADVDKYDESLGEPRQILEITLRGTLGIPNSTLEIQKIREKALEKTGALHVRVRNFTAPREFGVAEDIEKDVSREKLESRVISDLVTRDKRYTARAESVSQAIVGAKRLALGDEPPEKIADFIAAKLLEENV